MPLPHPESLHGALPVLFLTAAFFLPGIVALLPLRVGWPAATALGPPVTVLMLTLGTFVLDVMDLPWTLATAAGFLLLPLVAAYLVSRRVTFQNPLVPPLRPFPAVSVAVGLTVGSLLICTALLRGMGGVGRASQGWDPIFHANALTWIQESGSATPWSLNPIYGEGAGRFYPAGWHSIVSLYPGDLVEAANASSIVIGGLIWPVGLVFLASVVLPRHPAVWAVTPVVAASFVSFPSSQLLRSGQWPNGLATALVPVALALIVLLIAQGTTKAGNRTLPDRFLLAALIVLVVGGSVAAHPSAAFALCAGALPFFLARALPAFVPLWRRRRRAAFLVAAVAAALGLTAATLLMTSRLLVGVMNYPRPPRAVLPDSLALALFDLPQFPSIVRPTVDSFNIVVGLLVIAGAIMTLLRREGRPLAASWLVFVILYVLAAGPENALRFLTGFWYKDTQRIAPFIALAGSLLAAFALVLIARGVAVLVVRAVRPRFPETGRSSPALTTITAIAAVLMLGATYSSSSDFRAAHRVSVAAHNYVTAPTPGAGVLSVGEQDFIRRAGHLVPRDAVVIGDPFNGETFFYTLAQRHVVYTQLGAPSATAAKALLRASFNRLREDETVCDAVREVGATHFYQDAPGGSHGSTSLDAWPGFYGVDTSEGFAPVLVEGSRGLFEITACR